MVIKVHVRNGPTKMKKSQRKLFELLCRYNVRKQLTLKKIICLFLKLSSKTRYLFQLAYKSCNENSGEMLDLASQHNDFFSNQSLLQNRLSYFTMHMKIYTRTYDSHHRKTTTKKHKNMFWEI